MATITDCQSSQTANSSAYDILSSGSTNWTTVANGLGTKSVSTTSGTHTVTAGKYIGSPYNYFSNQAVVSFDTSSIPTSDTVTSVEMLLFADYVKNDFGVGYYVNVLGYDYGGSYTTSDWVNQSNSSTLKVADNSAMTSFPVYNNTPWVFTGNSLFNSYINKGGTTRVVLSHSKLMDSTAPTIKKETVIYFNTYYVSHALYGGIRSPILRVTHEAGGFEHLDISGAGLTYAASGSGYYLENSGAGYIRKSGTEGPGSLILDANGRTIIKGS